VLTTGVLRAEPGEDRALAPEVERAVFLGSEIGLRCDSREWAW
jgi:hypothetical protein